MGVKLALARHPRLRNVRIDELWEEASRQQLPRSAWRTFVQERLCPPPPKSLAGHVGSALGALALASDQPAGVRVVAGALHEGLANLGEAGEAAGAVLGNAWRAVGADNNR